MGRGVKLALTLIISATAFCARINAQSQDNLVLFWNLETFFDWTDGGERRFRHGIHTRRKTALDRTQILFEMQRGRQIRALDIRRIRKTSRRHRSRRNRKQRSSEQTDKLHFAKENRL